MSEGRRCSNNVIASRSEEPGITFVIVILCSFNFSALIIVSVILASLLFNLRFELRHIEL